jgi:hypothetical protein
MSQPAGRNNSGFLGYVVGIVMAYENRERNQWAASLLQVQPGDQILCWSTVRLPTCGFWLRTDSEAALVLRV